MRISLVKFFVLFDELSKLDFTLNNHWSRKTLKADLLRTKRDFVFVENFPKMAQLPVLKSFKGICVILYLDDILVYKKKSLMIIKSIWYLF